MSSENNLPYILWLPSWYPCKLTPYDGDFIQRHAQAVSLYHPVHVLHIIRDKEGTVTKDISVEERQDGNLKETIIYYYCKPSFFKLADSFLSIRKYTRTYQDFLAGHFAEYGLPSLVHVHIAFKAGIIAKWIRKNRGVEYLITEQWTVYLEEAKPNFSNLSFSARYLISKIMNDALLITPVSEYLAAAIQKKWPSAECEIVPNVVNTAIFYPEEKAASGKLKLIHISTLAYQKDPESLIEAAGILKRSGVDFSLDIFGPVNEQVQSLIAKEGVDDCINMKGEVPQNILAEYMMHADALVLYSRYETFGCVLIEANACGIPVIVPDTKLMHEIVENNVNGILVHPASSSALAEALINFSKIKDSFSKQKIAAHAAAKYSYARVGKMYSEIYSRYT